jgi:hypothetical protein
MFCEVHAQRKGSPGAYSLEEMKKCIIANGKI